VDLTLTRVDYRFDYPFPPKDVVEFFRENYGPMNRAFHTLPAAKWEALRAELVELWAGNNRESGARTAVDAEYLYVKGTRS
jgi:hypothetical protein